MGERTPRLARGVEMVGEIERPSGLAELDLLGCTPMQLCELDRVETGQEARPQPVVRKTVPPFGAGPYQIAVNGLSDRFGCFVLPLPDEPGGKPQVELTPQHGSRVE